MTTEKKTQQNNSRTASGTSLRELRKKLVMRAVFSVVTLLLAAVLLFSLTAAWFTNVADTGALTFVAKKWDFNGSITVGEGAVSIAPGMRGVIPLHITNDGAETAVAGVSVSKASLSELMQKRLYFYVDTPFYRNGERMSRVFLSENGGYAYTVFGGSEIHATEQSQNVPLLRWEWVYDVLGYYVRGGLVDGAVQIDEYVRPIEYDYDPITTTFREDGGLATVDGEVTAQAFLSALSATDGYAGEIDTGAVTADGYYPVSVNAEGYGIWAYLCTYDEIQQGMADDTAMGEAAQGDAHAVEIRVTGSSTHETALAVDSAELLSALLSSTGHARLRLTKDITLTEQLLLASGYRADIDLGGYTLRLAEDAPICAEEGSVLSLSNGTLSGGGQLYAIEASGAGVTLDGVTVEDVTYGVKITDHLNAVGADSRLHVVDSRISADSVGVWVYGNGGEGTVTTVVIERSYIVGQNYAGIVGNGSYSGTAIQVKDSVVQGYYTAIYHPQRESTLTIENSNLTGLTGLVIKGGTVAVHDTVIRGTGTPEQIAEPEYFKSGFSDTGDGIYLETNYDGGIEVTVTGKSTHISSASAYAVRKFAADDVGAVISLHEGTYNTDVSAHLAIGAQQSVDAEGNYTVSMKE